MRLDIRRTIALLEWCATGAILVGGVTSTDARAQAADVMTAYFREDVADVAEAGKLSRLDSTALASGVRREIRIYTGFGLGSPDRVVRLWQDERDVHGWLGVFWRTGLPRTLLPPDAERARRDELRDPAARLKAWIDWTYGCRAATQSRTTNVCWLDEQPDRIAWENVFARLDSLGVESIPMPIDPKVGFDGWMIVVEVRNRAGYRMYSFWSPDSSSTDPGEHAAADVAAVVQEAFDRRRKK
jgi:hypothetical protein